MQLLWVRKLKRRQSVRSPLVQIRKQRGQKLLPSVKVQPRQLQRRWHLVRVRERRQVIRLLLVRGRKRHKMVRLLLVQILLQRVYMKSLPKERRLPLVIIQMRWESLLLPLVLMILLMAHLRQAPGKVLPSVREQRRQVQHNRLPLARMLFPRVRNPLLSVIIPVQQGIHPLPSVATIGISYGLNELRQQEINWSIKYSKS